MVEAPDTVPAREGGRDRNGCTKQIHVILIKLRSSENYNCGALLLAKTKVCRMRSSVTNEGFCVLTGACSRLAKPVISKYSVRYCA